MNTYPDAHELGLALRRGELSCRELVADALARREPAWDAYRSTDDERSLRHADAVDQALRAGLDLGPWMGIPTSVKDLYGVPGFATYAGSPTRLPSAWERPGPVVDALVRQLAIVVGKTHTVEFAFGGLGTNPHTPTPRNPWDPVEHRVPGGSSSGAGVSLCEGSAWLALGTDTAGSVRIPASYTGNLGLKTTHGRWSVDGIVPLSPTLDSAGILTRTVTDLELGYTTLDPRWTSRAEFLADGPHPSLQGLRLGRCDVLLWDDCSAGIVETIETVVGRVERDGARIVHFELPEIEPAYALFREGGPVPAELYHFLSSSLPDALATLDPNVRRRTESGATMTAVEYLRRRACLGGWQEAARQRCEGIDVWIAPTVAITPPKVADLAGDGYAPRNLLALRNTAVVSYLGMCAITLPVGLDRAGMPVGLMLVGRPGADDLLVALARVFEPYLLPPRMFARPSLG